MFLRVQIHSNTLCLRMKNIALLLLMLSCVCSETAGTNNRCELIVRRLEDRLIVLKVENKEYANYIRELLRELAPLRKRARVSKAKLAAQKRREQLLNKAEIEHGNYANAPTYLFFINNNNFNNISCVFVLCNDAWSPKGHLTSQNNNSNNNN